MAWQSPQLLRLGRLCEQPEGQAGCGKIPDDVAEGGGSACDMLVEGRRAKPQYEVPISLPESHAESNVLHDVSVSN